jgi:SAM-dependent methyltransferase
MLSRATKRLNLGCGQKKIAGYINVDNNPLASPDIFYDLNILTYPFKNNSADEVIMDHVLEHLDNPIKVIEELYRISKNNAIIEIKSPHFSCNWLHPGHKSAISTMLFDYFKHEGNDYYCKCSFEPEMIELHWLRDPQKRNFIIRLINYIINFFANIHIGFSQRIWCYWVGGFEEVYFKVKVKK